MIAQPPADVDLDQSWRPATVEAAFRDAVNTCLAEFAANREAACAGEVEAVHRMRIARTRLRTTLSFFAPLLDDKAVRRIRRELKWLNGYLGAVRDLDILEERVATRAARGALSHDIGAAWRKRRDASHRKLARALRSQRYARFIEATAAWARSVVQPGDGAAQPAADFVEARLKRWFERLRERWRTLEELRPRQQHALRIHTKRMRYAMEMFGDLCRHRNARTWKATLSHLRDAQTTLGRLNDIHTARNLIGAEDGPAGAHPKRTRAAVLPGRRKTERIMADAAAACHWLAKAAPLRK